MTLAVTHLVSLGHTRIGLALGPKRFVPVQRKIEGFVRAMQDQLSLPPGVIESDLVQHSLYTLEGGQRPRRRSSTATARRSSAPAT